MEKYQPPPYQGLPSAPEESDYPPPQGGHSQNVYPPQDPPHYPGYPPQSGYQSQSGYPPESGYPPQSGYPQQPGYESHPIPPPLPVPGSPPQVVYVLERLGWFSESQRNKPQSNSLAAATLIFTSGGMSLAWSVGFTSSEFYGNLGAGAARHMQVCWFIAVIIGACISAILIEKLTKRVLNLLASVLVIANGILFVSAPHSVAAIVIARYCDGIAFGLTVIPAIVAGSEQAVKRLRGLVLSTEQIGIVTGVMLKIIYSNLWSYTWELDSNQMHGILALVYGVLAFVFSLILTIESPIFYLRKNNEPEAINVLRRLQRPQVVTTETYALLYENKHLLQEDNARGHAINVSTGLVPLVKMCLFRAFVTMSISFPLTVMLFLSASLSSNSSWGLYTYALMRLIGIFIAIFTLDSVGRKGISAFAILVGGGLLIGLGAKFNDALDSFGPVQMGSVLGLLIAYQAFAGLAAPASTCYLGEAFSVSVKPYFILVAVIFENIIQIIICCTFQPEQDSPSAFVFTLGALQIAYAILFFVVMPETKQTTLREALAKFKETLNIGNY